MAIQQLFSVRRTCLNYPNESEWCYLGRGWETGPCKGRSERGGEKCAKVTGCPVKLNGACWFPNEPVLAGGLTHSDLPLCTSLSHLCCQGTAVNPGPPWTLAPAKPIHILNKDLAWKIVTSWFADLCLLSYLAFQSQNSVIYLVWPGKSRCC